VKQLQPALCAFVVLPRGWETPGFSGTEQRRVHHYPLLCVCTVGEKCAEPLRPVPSVTSNKNALRSESTFQMMKRSCI